MSCCKAHAGSLCVTLESRQEVIFHDLLALSGLEDSLLSPGQVARDNFQTNWRAVVRVLIVALILQLIELT